MCLTMLPTKDFTDHNPASFINNKFTSTNQIIHLNEMAIIQGDGTQRTHIVCSKELMTTCSSECENCKCNVTVDHLKSKLGNPKLWL